MDETKRSAPDDQVGGLDGWPVENAQVQEQPATAESEPPPEDLGDGTWVPL